MWLASVALILVTAAVFDPTDEWNTAASVVFVVLVGGAATAWRDVRSPLAVLVLTLAAILLAAFTILAIASGM